VLYFAIHPSTDYINITMAAPAPAPQAAPTPPPPTLWQCHKCKDGPVKWALQKECATCQHPVCKDCKKDDAIPPPIGTTAARVRASPVEAIDPSIWPTSQVPRIEPASMMRSRAAHDHRLSSRPNRPSAAGWWRCSECRNVNNPELAPSRCSSCAHVKCSSCTAVRR
jgi:hypothetical protein